MRISSGNGRVTLAQGAVGQQVLKRGVGEIEEDASIDLVMLFDPGHCLDKRILSEQFRY